MKYDNNLKHYGVLGMRWGRRKKPEYELKGRRKSKRDLTEDANDKHNKGKKGLSDKQKKALKIGLTTVGVAIASYGAYRLYKSGKLDKVIDSGKDKVEAILGKKGSTKLAGNLIDPISGFKKLSKPESISEAVKNANPGRFIDKSKYANNCTRCSLATFLRTIGI